MRVHLGIVIALIFVSVSCGEPQINPPQALHLIYLPLDGAIDVELDVEIQVYFSDAVDQTSIDQFSMKLESADVDDTVDPYQCDDGWSATTWQPARDDTKPQMVEFQPETPGGLLNAGTCYQITCTTDVKGENTGPLQDMGDSKHPDVGALGIFRTKE